MASRSLLLAKQRAWAERNGLALGATGHLPDVDANLHQPLSARARADFESRGRAEYRDSGGQLARMRSLHSSAALAVNVFDHWNTTDNGPLATALGFAEPIRRLTFEPHFPTGLEGDPPSPDLVLELGSRCRVAIECKFSEWLVPKRQRRALFKTKYFPRGAALWRERGFPACQALAEDLQSGRAGFRYLDARQLLKHVLGLATPPVTGSAPAFTLIYLYFEWPGSIGVVHAAEVSRFAGQIDAGIDFRVTSYQALYRELRQRSRLSDQTYLDYLQARYFP